LVALIIATPGIIGAIIALMTFRQSRKNTAKLKEIDGNVNGKMVMLLEATGATEQAKGVAEGRQAGADETAGRVAESERVEDRADKKAQEK
jgi:hypothetical protein